MFQHFPHIEQFHNVVKSVGLYPEILPKGDLVFGMKNKLHGTNAAIQVRFDGPFSTKQRNFEVLAQSRSRIISPGDDNMGFATWMDQARHETDGWKWPGLEAIYSLSYTEKELRGTKDYPPVTIFGEWCGKGIMKGVAISEIDTKVFCIFAVVIGDHKDENAWVMVEPSQIERLVPIHPQIKVIPFMNFVYENDQGGRMESDFLSIEFTNPLDKVVDLMNALVADIERCDPFVKDQFGVEGTGEGIVFHPMIDGTPFIQRDYYSNLIFKAKGEKHKVTKQRNAVQIDPEVMASITEFVQASVTEARLEQAAREVGRGVTCCELDFDMKKVGPFLAWIGNDIKREMADELEASGLNWKEVQKNIQVSARTWYIAKCKEL